MYFNADAQRYNGEPNENRDFARLRFTVNHNEEHFNEELRTMQFRLHEAYLQVNNESDVPTTLDFEIEHSRKSSIKITGTENILARKSIAFGLQFNENAIQDFDYVHADANGYKKPVWLMGTFALLPALNMDNGIAAGKVIAVIDAPNSKESRTIEYTLLDECIHMNMTATNTSGQWFRLKITNSFLFAATAGLEVKDLVEEALRPNDMFQVRIMIRPSGRVSCTNRRL